MRAAVVAVCVFLACSPAHTFIPSGTNTYDARPTDYPVAFYPEEPETTDFVVVGYAECRATSVKGALPFLEKLARKAGGDALIRLESTQAYQSVLLYRATVIRYK